jgi:hypothetical protein
MLQQGDIFLKNSKFIALIIESAVIFILDFQGIVTLTEAAMK